ncbi:hypothetical protein BZG36_01049 [Bifiguratus adelaidae]|uniref:Lethal giant larvae (Lgl)-like C-terminal domain-containing protein n=1 Tax=Bifiguratus adelaidae TaxID=1938954 RepID=A0A261Y6G0_9FUNG|nr:hypothetical protein BZG36_01049 [Bifiguratus adelaidae]
MLNSKLNAVKSAFPKLDDRLRSWIPDDKRRLEQVNVSRDAGRQDLLIREFAEQGLAGRITTVAYDPVQSLLAVGSNKGLVTIFSASASDTSALYTNGSIKYINFIYGTPYVVAIDSKNYIHMFDLRQYGRRPVFSYALPRIVTCTEHIVGSDWLLLGLNDGTVMVFDVSRRWVSDVRIPYLLDAQQAQPHPSKPLTGHRRVEMIQHVQCHPFDLNLILIVYEAATVLYSVQDNAAVRTFSAVSAFGHERNHVTAIAWFPQGDYFAVGHEDGTLAFWDSANSSKPVSVQVLPLMRREIDDDGPTPEAGPIYRLIWCSFGDANDSILFVGSASEPTVVQGVQMLHYTGNTFSTPNTRLFLPIPEDVDDFVCFPRNNPYQLSSSNPYNLTLISSRSSLLLLHIDNILAPNDWQPHRLPVPMHGFDCPIENAWTFDVTDEAAWFVQRHASQQAVTEAEATDRDWLLNGSPLFVDPSSTASVRIRCTIHRDGELRFWSALTKPSMALWNTSFEPNAILPAHLQSKVVRVIANASITFLLVAFRSGAVVGFRCNPDLGPRVPESPASAKEDGGQAINLDRTQVAGTDRPGYTVQDDTPLRNVPNDSENPFVSDRSASATSEQNLSEHPDFHALQSDPGSNSPSHSPGSQAVFRDGTIGAQLTVVPARSYDNQSPFIPFFIKDFGSAVTSGHIIDETSVALGTYDGQICVIDWSKPTVIYETNLHSEAGEGDQDVDWPTCIRAANTFADQQEVEAQLRLLVGTRSGKVMVLDVDSKAATVQQRTTLMTEVGQRVVNIQVIDLKLRESPEAKGKQAFWGRKHEPQLILITNEVLVSARLDVSNSVLYSATIGDDEHVILTSQVVEMSEGSRICACVLSNATIQILGLPSLQTIGVMDLPNRVDVSRLFESTLTPDGYFFGWTREGTLLSVSLLKEHAHVPSFTELYDEKKPMPDRHKAQAENSGGWLKNISKALARPTISVSQLDQYFGVSNKPPPIATQSKAVPKQDATKGPFSELRQVMNERGERLGQLNDKFGAMSDASHNFLSSIREYNARQAAKKWYEF